MSTLATVPSAAGVMRACSVCGDGTPPKRPLFSRNGSDLFRCPECGLVFWGSVWGAEQVKEHYHNYYAPGRVEYDPLTERCYHEILQRFERLRPVGRLLDVGCGAGHFLVVAEQRGWQGCGVEVSRSALTALRQVQQQRGLAFSIVEGSLAQAPFPPEHFDVITLFEVVEHLDDPLATLRQAYSFLKDGGILYLTTPNYDSLSRHLIGHRWRVIAEEHRCLFSAKTLRDYLVRVGFRPVGMATKNIDIPEILSAWGIRKAHEHPTIRTSASQRLRHTIEGVGWLRAAKTGANQLLRVLQLGDTLEALAVKRGVDLASPCEASLAACESSR